MLSGISYYELLDCAPEASDEQIKKNYEAKIKKIALLPNTNRIDLDYYNTALCTLTDPEKRLAYDRSIGILHKNKINPFSRIIFGLSRILLTFFDILIELFYCLTFTVISLGLAAYAYSTHEGIDIISDSGLKIQKCLPAALSMIVICIILYLIHPIIRRKNRALKHSMRKYL